MPIDSKLVGSNERQIVVIGDPLSANKWASVLSIADATSLSGLFASLGQNVQLLENPGGTFDVQRAAVGTTGIPAVSTEGSKTTYSVSVNSFTPAATATDFFTFVGSGTKTGRLLQVTISGFATAAATVEIQLIKRSTANTGGTASQPAIAKHDSNDGAPTCVANLYSVNPSGLGTSANVVRARKLNLGAAGAAGSIVWDFSTRNSKGLVVRGVAEQYALNWNGAAVPAGTTLCIEAEFSEE